MKIGIDIMGGDFAPDATVAGAILAYNELPNDVGAPQFEHVEIVDATALS